MEIRTGDIDTVVQLSREIPEFIAPHPAEVYRQRLNGVPHLILVAWVDQKAVAFKVGYERDGGFYSWMGGVLPDFRRMGIAQTLADQQEVWARQNGYQSITFKTRSHHKGMLIFAIRNGFDIIGFKEKESVLTNRIILRKTL